jgi:hypothetical protein
LLILTKRFSIVNTIRPLENKPPKNFILFAEARR